MVPDSYEKFVQDSIAFRKSVWGAKEVIVKPMPDGRALLYFDGTYGFDLKESYQKYLKLVEHSNKTIELWKERIKNKREGGEPMKYESWGNLTYEDVWRQCKADIKNGKQDFKFKDISDWRPASSMYTNLPIDLIPNALVLYLNCKSFSAVGSALQKT